MRGWNSAFWYSSIKATTMRGWFSIAVQFLHCHMHFRKLKFNSYEHNLTVSHFNAELDQTCCAFNMCSRREVWLRRQR
jgi:hypothetical protein